MGDKSGGGSLFLLCPSLSVREGCRENRRKRQQNQACWGREHRMGSGRGGGFTEPVSWLDPAGWHQVLRPRQALELRMSIVPALS